MLIQNVEFINGIWRGKIQLNSWVNFFEDVKYIDLNLGGDSKVEKIQYSHKLVEVNL